MLAGAYARTSRNFISTDGSLSIQWTPPEPCPGAIALPSPFAARRVATTLLGRCRAARAEASGKPNCGNRAEQHQRNESETDGMRHENVHEHCADHRARQQ